ncbi:UNVERIFIED_CONTAM: hypothetical protein Sradi_6530600 [Sesamum radiatum]|uniref:Uncharacterized protein n=1 Tax=Sesamum radiatum TaxID=300843 RepID=A0AAW2JXC4_SESRA
MQEPWLEEIPADGITSHQTATQFGVRNKGGSSTSNPKKRKDCVYVDPNRADAARQILTQEYLTKPGPSLTQPSVIEPSVQGPSMYEQLQMGQRNINVQAQITLQPRLNIRAPPPMTGNRIMLCFSSKPVVPVPKTINKQHGHKYVNLSNWPSSQNPEAYGKN